MQASKIGTVHIEPKADNYNSDAGPRRYAGCGLMICASLLPSTHAWAIFQPWQAIICPMMPLTRHSSVTRKWSKAILLNFVPEDFVADFDFDTLEPCNGSYTTTDLSQRQDDIVWRLRWKNSTWCYVYLILEFQSSQDRWMPLRILTYTALLWEDLIKKDMVQAGEMLPPVFPLVIYNGSSPWNAARDVSELLAKMPPDLATFQPRQKYFLLDVLQLGSSDVDNAQGVASLLVRFERAQTSEELQAIMVEMSKSLSNEKYDFLWRSMLNWIGCLAQKLNLDNIKPSDNGEEAMLAERIAQWEQEFYQKGIQQGISEGLSQCLFSQQSTLIDMLTDRFGEVPQNWQQDITQIKEADTLRN